MSMRLKNLLILLALATVSGGVQPSGDQEKGKGPGGHGDGMPPSEVTAITATAEALPVTWEYVGQTAGSREVEVRARVTGILLSRNFREGERVKKGQSLFTIDPAPFQAAAARAEADVVAAQARLDQARRNAARLKPLYAEKAVSQKEYDDAVSSEAIGAADVKAAQARLTEAKLSLEYTRVEAPVSGITTRALPSEGTLVSGPSVLLTSVVQVDPIWVNFGMPDNEQARIQKEAQEGSLKLPRNFEVELRLADGSVYGQRGKLDFADVRVSHGHRHARSARRGPEPRRRPAPGPVRARGAERRDAAQRHHRSAARRPRRTAGQVRLRRRREGYRAGAARPGGAVGGRALDHHLGAAGRRARHRRRRHEDRAGRAGESGREAG